MRLDSIWPSTSPSAKQALISTTNLKLLPRVSQGWRPVEIIRVDSFSQRRRCFE
uniref:Uncharacterized protein n=1 Tax=Echinococcus granulosus TaxID=6210 RepID=A0A068WKA8_ECHGR|nr:hypothetical protein EgrG_000240800 [Echinococcus granulosus]